MPQPRHTGRPATWCSDRCKRAAYEERRAAVNGAIAVKIVEKVVQQEPHASTRVLTGLWRHRSHVGACSTTWRSWLARDNCTIRSGMRRFAR